MKTSDFTFVWALVLGVGCTATRTEPSRSVFAFEHGGNEYEIVSVAFPVEGGYNVLVRRDGAAATLQGKDLDQDGVLDTLLAVGAPLERIDAIYAAGVAQAEAQGKFRVRPNQRLYELALAEGRYAVLTFPLEPDRSANKFTYVAAPAAGTASTQSPVVFLDFDADGVLDRAEGGEDISAYQKRYDYVLQAGVRDGQIEHTGPTYRVRPTAR